MTCYSFDEQVKIWIRLKNGKEFNSAPVKLEGDFNGLKAIINDTSVKVFKTKYFQYLRYFYNFLIVIIFLFVFKILVNIFILKPENKVKYIVYSLLLNVIFLIVLFFLIYWSSTAIQFKSLLLSALTFYLVLGICFFSIIKLEIILASMVFAKNKKRSLIIKSSIISNIFMFIFGFILLIIINYF